MFTSNVDEGVALLCPALDGIVVVRVEVVKKVLSAYRTHANPDLNRQRIFYINQTHPLTLVSTAIATTGTGT